MEQIQLGKCAHSIDDDNGYKIEVFSNNTKIGELAGISLVVTKTIGTQSEQGPGTINVPDEIICVGSLLTYKGLKDITTTSFDVHITGDDTNIKLKDVEVFFDGLPVPIKRSDDAIQTFRCTEFEGLNYEIK